MTETEAALSEALMKALDWSSFAKPRAEFVAPRLIEALREKGFEVAKVSPATKFSPEPKQV